MIAEPVIDARRVESLVRELRRYAPHYVPDVNLTDEHGAGAALMRICAQLVETVLVRLGRVPRKHFVAFLDRLGVSLLPARPAQAAVTFRLTSGLLSTVRVPAGTRVTATGPDGDIPFETTHELLAIPGTLTAAYGVDPTADKIYAPPPDFLSQDIRTPTDLTYTVQTFAPRNAKRLQLDHVVELKPGAFLRIDRRHKAVVDKVVDGNIVALQAPLDDDVPSGSLVTPIRDFEVFDGIDRQEHILYVGDADLFTVKQPARITLEFSLQSSAGGGLVPLTIDWQFWTKQEDGPPDSEEHWHDLRVDIDETAGLSTSGRVVLVKPDVVNPDGSVSLLEIKERDVGGRKSRWIRAKLHGALQAPAALPQIESLGISVNSPPLAPADPDGGGIAADQGFHNATPLEMQVLRAVGFFPFGTEPRQFDQFYVASKEAFSKRDAEVTLAFDLDLQTLAEPSVVMTSGGLRAYSIGLRRRLYELDVANGDWAVLGSPGDTPQGAGFHPLEDAAPVSLTDGGSIYTFVVTKDLRATDPAKAASKVWVHFGNSAGTVRKWVDLDLPQASDAVRQVKFNPAAVLLPAGFGAFARAFVVGEDGILRSKDLTSAPEALAGSWKEYSADSWQIASSPFATVIGLDIGVFVTGSDGIVHWRTLFANGTAGPWVALPQANLFTAVSRPFAQASASRIKVLVVGKLANGNRHVFERDLGAGGFDWQDLGGPPAASGAAEASAPIGYLENPGATQRNEEGKHIFLQGSDNNLYELLDDEAPAGPGKWQPRTRTGDPPLRDAPALSVVTTGATTELNVVSASNRNSLVAWKFTIQTMTVADAERRAVILPTAASADDDAYTGSVLTVTKSMSTTTENDKVIAYEGQLRLARLEDKLSFAPASASCQIGITNVGPASADSDKLVALGPPGTPPGVLRIDGKRVEPQFYSQRTGVALLGVVPTSIYPLTLEVEPTLAKREFLSATDTSAVPELSWEYWNGSGWLSLPVVDHTQNLLTSGHVDFTVPASIQPAEVAGQENFWIRARLVGGDYGRETFKVVKQNGQDVVVSEKSTLRPPKVAKLRIAYVGAPVPPAVCLTFNNLEYRDQTAAARIGDARFRPFEPLEAREDPTFEDRSYTLFLGFDRPFKTGPVRLLIDAAEREYDEAHPPELEWRFLKDRRWRELDPEDGSVALTRQGILTLVASDELTRESRFGQSLFWIRGSLRTDRGVSSLASLRPLLRGIFVNTVRAVQGETILDEIVASSDGEPNQRHRLQHADVLPDEDVRVLEALSAEEQEQVEREHGPDSVAVRDDIGGPWVRWQPTEVLFDAGPHDRCYVIDRASGLIQFGDGVHGQIPPGGVDNIRAFTYRTGGGTTGNVEAGKIEALATAVAGVDSVFNPRPAGGGSDKATTEAMLTIGPRRISHRDRAVSAEDFEELAQEASREVAKVRCLATTNLRRRGEDTVDPCDPALRHEPLRAAGWVSLIIVPESTDPRPCPTLELRRAVRDYLRERAPSLLAAGERIVVRPPDYVEVSVSADVFVQSLDQASEAEKKGRLALEALLHPLHGGPEGGGWEFGRPISKSDVFNALEAIEEIDRVEHLWFTARGRRDPDGMVIGPNDLLASGSHQLRIRKA